MLRDTKFNSQRTAITRKNPSAPMRYLVEQGYIKDVKSGMAVLDFGCGKGKDVDYLRSKGVYCSGYDPYQDKFHKLCLGLKWDVITCIYVLNVVDIPTRLRIIDKVKSLLKPDGVAYFAVRRDVKQPTITRAGTHQYPVYTPYKVVKENSSFCIYEINKYETRDIIRKSA